MNFVSAKMLKRQFFTKTWSNYAIICRFRGDFLQKHPEIDLKTQNLVQIP